MSFIGSKIQVLGCGNTLKGDDGFGPVVASYIEQHYDIPEDIAVIDAGMACGEWIAPLIHDDQRPEKLIIIDVLDMGLEPGALRVLTPEKIKFINTTFSYSSHFFPDGDTFKELMNLGMEILFISCQLKKIPRDLSMKLSPELEEIVPKAASKVAEIVGLELKKQ